MIRDVTRISFAFTGTFAEIRTRGLAYTEFRYKNIKSELNVRLQACEGAHVAMFSGFDHSSSSRSYVLVIGGQGNTMTYITRSELTAGTCDDTVVMQMIYKPNSTSML